MKQEKQKSILQVPIANPLRDAFKEWCDKNGYASESEAVRGLIRNVTKNQPACQG